MTKYSLPIWAYALYAKMNEAIHCMKKSWNEHNYRIETLLINALTRFILNFFVKRWISYFEYFPIKISNENVPNVRKCSVIFFICDSVSVIFILYWRCIYRKYTSIINVFSFSWLTAFCFCSVFCDIILITTYFLSRK